MAQLRSREAERLSAAVSLGETPWPVTATAAGVAICMDGKGAWRDNVFVEQLWRTIKYEGVYLQAYDSVREARASISRYVAFYNSARPFSSLDCRTPDEAYLGLATVAQAA